MVERMIGKKNKSIFGQQEGAGTSLRLPWLAALCAMLMVFVCGMFSFRAAAAEHVYDLAELFSSSESSRLETLASELESEYKMHYFLLTTDNAYGMSSSEFAEYFYEEEGFDSDGKKGGIVLLIDLENRELNLVTNGDMIYYITDAREENIYNEGYSYASEGEYGEAMYAMLSQVQEYMEEGVPGNQYTYDSETGRIVEYKSITSTDLMIAVLVPLLVAGIVCFILYRKYSVVEKYKYEVRQNSDMKLTGQQDRLVNQFVTQRRIQRNPPPGEGGMMGGPGGGMGGSFGGRSTTHTSSGGGTFGGGNGRRF